MPNEFTRKLAKASLSVVKDNMPPEYASIFVKARRDYIDLRLRSELDIIKLYEEVAKELAKELRQASGLNKERIRDIMRSIRSNLQQEYTALLRRNIENTARIAIMAQKDMLDKIFTEAGIDAVTSSGLTAAYQAVSADTVRAIYTRKRNGLTLSQRVWTNTQKSLGIVQRAIVKGDVDAREMAITLEKYLADGADALTVGESKDLYKRLGGTVPKDVKYNALRLARTELSSAFAESTYSSGNNNPFYEGIIWRLSSRHQVKDICDDLEGFHPAGSEPMTPHPNCLCSQLPQVKSLSSATDEAIAWVNNPNSNRRLEKWYQDVYVPNAS